MDKMFRNHHKFYNIKSLKALLGYANAQAKKYGLKGNRMKVFKQLLDDPYLRMHEHDEECRLDDLIYYIITRYGTKNNCTITLKKNKSGRVDTFLLINDSLHMLSMRFPEFVERVKKEYSKYGKRSERAMISDGKDYKALSHAYRCYIQYEELVKNGRIDFPLTRKLDFIKKIKNGEVEHQELMHEMQKRVDVADELDVSGLENKYDEVFVKNFILGFYKNLN